jgi:hypothetical protein
MKTTMVISTIGCPFIHDCLATLKYPPDQVLVVIDVTGRTCADLPQPLPEFEAELKAKFPFVTTLRAEPSDNWAVMNGCYNLGILGSRNEYIMFTHDDLSYPDFDYFGAISPILDELEAADRKIDGKEVVGVLFPDWEVTHQVHFPAFPDKLALCQSFSPVTHVISRRAMLAMGGFDEVEGIWYDQQAEEEIRRRNWWSIHLPTPPIHHVSNRTYKVNNWGNRWAANPKWGNTPENFKRVYGCEASRNWHDYVP